jgi:hypothetical protein
MDHVMFIQGQRWVVKSLVKSLSNPQFPDKLRTIFVNFALKSAIFGQSLGHFGGLKSAKSRTDIRRSFRGPDLIPHVVHSYHKGA